MSHMPARADDECLPHLGRERRHFFDTQLLHIRGAVDCFQIHVSYLVSKQLPDSSIIRAACAKENKYLAKKTAGAFAPAACLGWPDSNRRVKESKSFALPLGDSPKCLFSIADCLSSDKPHFAPGLSPPGVLRASQARARPRRPVRSRNAHDKNRRRPPRPRPGPSRCPRCTRPPPG